MLTDIPPSLLELLTQRAKVPTAPAATPLLSAPASVALLTTITDEQKAHLRAASAHPAYLDSLKDNGPWTDHGYALLSLGEVGREIWLEVCSKAPNYDPDAAVQWWENHRLYTPRCDFRSIYGKSAKLGWVNPRLSQVAAAGEFEAIEGEYMPAVRAAVRFALIPDNEFVKRPPLEWHTKGIVPKAELVVIYGASGSGKSFFVFYLLAAIANGTAWQGCRTKQGRVVYIAAEGAVGLRNRVQAYAQHNEGAFPGIGIIAAAPNLFSGNDHARLAEVINQNGGADVIVIDTLSATAPGANENAGEDMGMVIAHCKRLHELTGATVVLIHHSGKDEAKGARGWSGLRAAIDAEIEVTRSGDTRTATVTKMKDGEEGAQFAFRLVPVEIGRDEDDDAITSCIVETVPLASLPRQKAGPKPGTVKRTLLDTISGDISGIGIPIADALEAAVARMPKPEKRDTRNQDAMRALRALESDGLIVIEGDRCRAL